jgi:hypothetical protein
MGTLINAMTDRGPEAHYVALLTATIAPRGAISTGLVRSDPKQRRGDYERALRAWLALDAPWLAGVVFAENSASSLSSLEAVARNENPKQTPVELISFDSAAPPEGLHYGYSELKLVRDAVAQSDLIKRAPYFIKATGRYLFPDVGRLVKKLPRDFVVAVDCKCSKRFARDRHFLTHFALAVFQRDFFNRYVAPIPEKMIPAPPWTRAQFVETMMFDELVQHRGKRGVILRWPCNCEPRGIGANGDNYGSPRRRLQAGLRGVGRRLFPWIWL